MKTTLWIVIAALSAVVTDLTTAGAGAWVVGRVEGGAGGSPSIALE